MLFLRRLFDAARRMGREVSEVRTPKHFHYSGLSLDPLSNQTELNIWWKLFKLSHRNLTIGLVPGVIALLWKGREFNSDDGFSFLLLPFAIVYLTAFLYAFGHVVQTRTGRGLRYFFVCSAVAVLVLFAGLSLVFSIGK